MAQEIKEYKVRIRDLDEEVRHYKVDKTNITEFRVYAYELQGYLGTTLRQLYTNLREFQDLSYATASFVRNDQEQKGLHGVHLAMDELKKWQKEEQNTLEDCEIWVL